MEKVVHYIAEDGSDFFDEQKCLNYEFSLKTGEFTQFKIGYNSIGSSCFPEDTWNVSIPVETMEQAWEAIQELFESAKNNRVYDEWESDMESLNDLYLTTLNDKPIKWENIKKEWKDMLFERFDVWIRAMKLGLIKES
jgi:hypothetical protein